MPVRRNRPTCADEEGQKGNDMYSTLKEAATAAFDRLHPDQRLFDGIDYWMREDLLIEANSREVSDSYEVDAAGNISIPGITDPIYCVSEAQDAERTGTQLSYYRHLHGMTQLQLAEASGVCVSTIRKIEGGTADIDNLTVRNAIGLAAALNTTVEELAMD